MEELVQFRWRRALGRGFVWRTLKVREGPFEKVLVGQRVLTFPKPFGTEGAVPVFEEIQPLKNRTLFWDFTDTEPSEKSIAEFATRFGLLVGNHFGSTGNKGPAYNGDPFELWVREIATARIARDLWDAIERKHLDRLGLWIRWPDQRGTVKFRYKNRRIERTAKIAGPTLYPETYALFKPNDVVLPARIMLARMINERLDEHAAPQMYWSAKKGNSGLYLSPRNLLGGMWIQFAQVVDGRRRIAKCENCGDWFEARQATAQYCKTSCRVSSNRRKKAVAQSGEPRHTATKGQAAK